LGDALDLVRRVGAKVLRGLISLVRRKVEPLAVVIVVLPLAAQPFDPLSLPEPFSFLLWIGFLGSNVAAQIYR
jgi:hypothetical protein